MVAIKGFFFFNFVAKNKKAHPENTNNIRRQSLAAGQRFYIFFFFYDLFRYAHTTCVKLKPRSCTGLLVKKPAMDPDHQDAQSPKNMMATKMAAVVPTNITTAATIATATAATATSVGTDDDGLGSFVPKRIEYYN